MKRSVRDATYRELLPAEMTLITMRALMRWAAGKMPASCNEIVNGELAVLDVDPKSLWSFHGMRIPIKNIVPSHISAGVAFVPLPTYTYQRKKSRYAKRPA
jgi:hypothetical protein